jgi:PiT family inorganic phosphate transporter
MTASTTTAFLVSLASWQGMPVSTTHVSTGAIIGAGLKHDAKSVHWNKVREILLSWLLTLPFAALIAAGAQLLMGLQ